MFPGSHSSSDSDEEPIRHHITVVADVHDANESEEKKSSKPRQSGNLRIIN